MITCFLASNPIFGSLFLDVRVRLFCSFLSLCLAVLLLL